MYEEYLRLRQADWSKVGRVGWCAWVGLALCLLFFSPFLLEALAVAVALAVLVPLALGLGLIEHFLPAVWLLVVLFIQVGGLADLVADFTLLVKVAVSHNQLPVEEGGEGDELQLLVARALITVIGALPTVLYFIILQKSIRRVLRGMGQDLEVESSSRTGPGASIVLIAIAWKIVMVVLRIYLLYRVARDIITDGRIRKESRPLIDMVEFYLLADLLWSGIPLGVLTFLELFIYGDGFTGGQTQIFELIKLAAVSIDAVAAAHLIYFGHLGLGKKCLHHEHEETHAHKPTAQPPKTTAAVPANTRATSAKPKPMPLGKGASAKSERQPLVTNKGNKAYVAVNNAEEQV